MASPNNTSVIEKVDNSATPPSGQKFDKPETVSVGEKWWNRITYTGVGYAANLALSVVLWDFFVSGGGKPVYHGIQKAANSMLKSGGMSKAGAENMSDAIAKYIFSPLGGHVTMAPVKIMEDHARYITHVLNKQLDPNYKYKDLKADWNTPDSELPGLANEPNRNTWTQAYLRRGIGWGAVVGSGMALRTIGLEGPLERGTLRALDKTVAMSGSSTLKQISQTPRFQRYAQLTALDAYLTVVTSIITALTKNTFGQAKESIADDALSVDIPGLTTSDSNGLMIRPPLPPLDKPHTPHSHKHKSHAGSHAHNHMKNHENFQDKVLTDKQNAAQQETHI